MSPVIEYPAQSFDAMTRKQAITTCYALESMRDRLIDEVARQQAGLERVRALCDSNAGCASRDGYLMVATIRKALDAGPAQTKDT